MFLRAVDTLCFNNLLEKVLYAKKDPYYTRISNIGELGKVAAFLKRTGEGKVIKKSTVFIRADIERFLCEAPNEQFLHIKVVRLFRIFWACRKTSSLPLQSMTLKILKTICL